MEDAAAYGRRAFDLTFAESIAKGLICDYRVVVSVVTSNEVSEYAITHGHTFVRGDTQSTQWIATQLAVLKAIRRTRAMKVITFHSRVSQAKAFASDSTAGMRALLPGFSVSHVNGSDPICERHMALAGFRGHGKRLVSNARCLTEGVDLPAVDMVVFNNPRRSRIDIVQAVGRAMRKPRDGQKRLGFVVVPVMLPSYQAKDVESACAHTEWEDVVAVLAALRDHDTRLDELIREHQRCAGSGARCSTRGLRERLLVIGPQVGLAAIQRAIHAQVISRLGSVWDFRFGELCAFRQAHGHCDVPKTYPPNRGLGSWVDAQRQIQRRGKMFPWREEKLQSLGLTWDPNTAFWAEQLAALERFRDDHGHCNVPRHCPKWPNLATWLSNQRHLHRKGLLPAERACELERLGVAWHPHEARWRERYASLLRFVQKMGHADVPEAYRPDPSLGAWLSAQRRLKKLGRLASERLALLNSAGVVWNPHDHRWDAMYRLLVDFVRKHGPLNAGCVAVPSRPMEQWIKRQRDARRAGLLEASRVASLEALGIAWAPRRDRWELSFEALVAFRKKNGHCDVPATCSREPQLATWVGKQRQQKRAGTLSKDRTDRLERLGFKWDPHAARWDSYLRSLVHFRSLHGHCNVPQRDPIHGKLGQWLNNQRVLKKRGQLTPQRIAALERIGVEWSLRQFDSQ
ncbi:MAG: Helicase associated domain protein [Planctomycetaceae bacterium]